VDVLVHVGRHVAQDRCEEDERGEADYDTGNQTRSDRARADGRGIAARRHARSMARGAADRKNVEVGSVALHGAKG
jgi:hypothetical protein